MFLLYFYLLTSDYTECSPVRKRRGLTSTPAHLCPVLSSPYQLHTHYSRESHVDMPSTGPITTATTKAYCPSCFLLTYTEAEVHIDTHSHNHCFFSIRLKHTVFTLTDPLRHPSYIVNPPTPFTRETSVARACMITSHTYSTFKPHLCSCVSVCECEQPRAVVVAF